MVDAAMAGKIAIVTGANSGIGLETARGLARMGATVVIACRDAARGEAARADIAATTGAGDRLRVIALDLASFASIRAFVAAFRREFDRLDVLIENAGVSPATRQTTADGLELTIGTNHVGHFLLAQALTPLLVAAAPSRIVVVSSALQKNGKLDLDDLQYEKRPFSWMNAYGASKVANVLFTVSLAEKLAGTGVTVNAVHPGVVSTALARDLNPVFRAFAKVFFTTAEKGARTSLFVATDPSLAGVTGRYFEKRKEAPMNPLASDKAARDRLWEMTTKLIEGRPG